VLLFENSEIPTITAFCNVCNTVAELTKTTWKGRGRKKINTEIIKMITRRKAA
jgi:hypothetical protein